MRHRRKASIGHSRRGGYRWAARREPGLFSLRSLKHYARFIDADGYQSEEVLRKR
jgi:hypothetical protein